jgi:orotate phosphoribosyltransferase
MTNHRPHQLNATMNRVFAESVRDMQELIDLPQANLVAQLLVKSGAFTVDLQLPPEQWFRWKCGIVAPCGCDCRSLNQLPDVRRRIDSTLAKAVGSLFSHADAIVGVANAGIPWAKTLAEKLHLPLAYVRSAPKTMGKGRLVECSPKKAQNALIIEDALVSGQSTKNVIDAVERETNSTICGVQSIVNWNFPFMRELLRGYPIRSLTSYPFILSCAFVEGLIDEAGYFQLMLFYRDPHAHPWATYYETVTKGL